MKKVCGNLFETESLRFFMRGSAFWWTTHFCIKKLSEIDLRVFLYCFRFYYHFSITIQKSDFGRFLLFIEIM